MVVVPGGVDVMERSVGGGDDIDDGGDGVGIRGGEASLILRP